MVIIIFKRCPSKKSRNDADVFRNRVLLAAEGIKQNFPHVTLHLGGLDQDVLCGAEKLVVSPGLPLATVEIQAAMLESLADCAGVAGEHISEHIAPMIEEFQSTLKLSAQTETNHQLI